MEPDRVFKRYDIRGEYPSEINTEFAEMLGKAFGRFVAEEGESKIVLTRDNKESSVELKERFAKGAKSSGINVLDAGVGPTDYTAFSGVENNCFSVQITASHMPLKFNGFKFMYPEGNGLMNVDLDRIKEIFRKRDFVIEEGLEKDIADKMSQSYRKSIKEYFNRYFGSIDGKIVLETMGGASSKFLPELLEDLGADVVDLSEESKEEGPRIDPPNPKPENLETLKNRVESSEAELGLATDMDADRVAVYYRGEWLDGNQIFSILAKIIEPNQIIGSIDTSKQVDKVAEDIGADINYTRVGDPFVISETLEKDAELSGEPNGHYCFTDFVPYNSGSLSALILAGADLSELGELPERVNLRSSIEVEDKLEKIRELKDSLEEKYTVISKVDGVKFQVNNCSVLIRASGSSPKLRIIVDAENQTEAAKAMKISEQLIRNQ